MSRKGSLKISTKGLTKFEIKDGYVFGENANGSFQIKTFDFLDIQFKDGIVTSTFKEDYFTSRRDIRKWTPCWGTFMSLLQGKIHGLLNPLSLVVFVKGTGYRVTLNGKTLTFKLGFSHLKDVALPDEIKAESLSQTEVKLTSVNKQVLNGFAERMHKLCKYNVYSDKGVSYTGRYVRHKEVKKK